MKSGDKNIFFTKRFKAVSPYLNLVGTLLVALPGTSLFSSNLLKILMLIFGVLILCLYIRYVRKFDKFIETTKTDHENELINVKITSISDFTKEVNSLVEPLWLDWDVNKANLYQDNIVNTVSNTLTNLGIKDVRVLLYGISAEENDDNYHLLLKKMFEKRSTPQTEAYHCQ